VETNLNGWRSTKTAERLRDLQTLNRATEVYLMQKPATRKNRSHEPDAEDEGCVRHWSGCGHTCPVAEDFGTKAVPFEVLNPKVDWAFVLPRRGIPVEIS